MNRRNDNKAYWLGIDIGSTTVKAALVNDDKELIYHDYRRHGAEQRTAAHRLLTDISDKFPDVQVIPVFCGSGSRELSRELGASYIQEVVANSLSVREFYPDTRVAIELGGQDAKVTFFHRDEKSGKLVASDMRMNGSCAGGTGAFLDEVAGILKLPIEELNDYASRGETVYDISGRCGVFAKTDIQPLLNAGIGKEDLALSCYHAIAKQTIGGLAQGLEIHPPVIFEGGPLHFNPRLVDVFGERLNLKENQIIRPENPEIMIAYGAALGVPAMFEEARSHPLGEFLTHNAFNHPDKPEHSELAEAYFADEEEIDSFKKRHELPAAPDFGKYTGQTLDVWLGIDAGSTTSKFVLLNDKEELVYTYYGKNHGEPLKVVRNALLDLKKTADQLNITLNIQGVGTTGYGELLFNKAFRGDYHTVETVAHTEAALKYAPGTSFILDIGGQDIKAIFLGEEGIVTGITLNEACSAGCGSFLENFADSLNIPVGSIAEMAFSSKAPSVLGSRCTVFMNSSIITEQKNGKTPSDIMAGLCNSIVENVFTKVIRLTNMKALGDRIVVQGGTFRNDAVLRALEKFTGREVVRAPYPGEMGAIGIALLTKKNAAGKGAGTRFLSWEELENFSYERETGLVCHFCSNNCNRTLIRFSGGESHITGNRCERGEILGDVKDPEAREKLKKLNRDKKQNRDLFKAREGYLLKEYPVEVISPKKDITIGLPRSLDFWESYPFWNTIYTALGFKTRLSARSNRTMFEEGLASVPSDTVCFPAKLAHGHLNDLIDHKVDRIFMPIMNRMVPENPSVPTSQHACAVLKGYPMVLQASQEPEEKHGIPFDTPVFHWTDKKARVDSIVDFFNSTFGLPDQTIRDAIAQGDKALDAFHQAMEEEGQALLDSLEEGEFAVVMAGRPYHSDPLINHNLSDYFTRDNIPVLPLDALPGLHKSRLDSVRAELTVNYHVRMFAAAQIVINDPRLEYVQIVSFGCGHDAVITDELNRLLSEGAGKSPLSIKMDESDVTGPLNIRVKSFVETVRTRRAKGIVTPVKEVKAYAKPYEKKDRKKTIYVPNVSWAFAQVGTAAIRGQGYNVEALPMGGERAIALGKKYVHNDMCFPAQINIGEFLALLESTDKDPEDCVLILAKDQCDCRLAHYAMMARQALDDAGYENTLLTTLDTDLKNLHPGFSLNPLFELRMLWGLVMNDALEDLRRKIRPYEKNSGETNKIFEETVLAMCDGFERSLPTAIKAYEKGVERLMKMDYDRSERKPRVFMIGEFLLNFHPGSNNYIEDYLEENDLEVIMPNLFYSIHREYLLEMDQSAEYHVSVPAVKLFLTKATEKYVSHVVKKVNRVAARHPLWEEKPELREIALRSQHIIDKTFTSGEGWMIAGEILHNAEHGVNSFLILQPFGCLPNHVTGRGLVKAIKKEMPHIQVLALDYDPDTSFANVENRLQMLIINTKERAKSEN
ncbi:MAG: acyl-CoA dehydratase activase [Spirochaetales bacterium]|nr:acyl-CoA dehydratase activase [Spirochaetales bacterium]